jgi:hypothetical protein
MVDLGAEMPKFFAPAKKREATYMTTMITMHQVSNYDEWRPHFDQHASMQTAAGLSNPRVYRLAESPNTLALFFDVTDRQRAEAFTKSPDLKAVMERAGVVGDVRFLFAN